MGKNLMGPAAEMVDLVKRIIREEEEKKDQVITATVQARNEANDTYDVYIDSEFSSTDRLDVMKNIPNESKHVYRPGDHVYILKVRGQAAQGFIIGSMGNIGVSINTKVKDLEEDLNAIKGATTEVSAEAGDPLTMIISPV